MSGTLVPPTAPGDGPDYRADPCDHGYVDIDKCPIHTPRPGMSQAQAKALAAGRASKARNK